MFCVLCCIPIILAILLHTELSPKSPHRSSWSKDTPLAVKDWWSGWYIHYWFSICFLHAHITGPSSSSVVTNIDQKWTPFSCLCNSKFKDRCKHPNDFAFENVSIFIHYQYDQIAYFMDRWRMQSKASLLNMDCSF